MVKAPTFAALQRILCGCHGHVQSESPMQQTDGPRCVCCPRLERSLSSPVGKRRTLLSSLSSKLRVLPSHRSSPQAGVDCRASVADTDDAPWTTGSATDEGMPAPAIPDESMGSLAAACRLLRSLSMAEDATCFVAGGTTSGTLLNVISRCGREDVDLDVTVGVAPGIIARTAAATALCNLLLLRLQQSKALQLHDARPLLEHLATLLQHPDGLIQRSAVRLIKVFVSYHLTCLSPLTHRQCTCTCRGSNRCRRPGR